MMEKESNAAKRVNKRRRVTAAHASNIIGMFRINARKSSYSFWLLLSFFPATMNDFSDSEMEALCRLVSIFSGGLPGGSLPPRQNNTDEVFKMWAQKNRTMLTTECQRLADTGNPERMHEFALRWVVDLPLVRFLLLTGHPSAAAGVGLPGSSPDVPRAERYWTRTLSSPRATKRNIATAHAHLVWCTGILFGAEGRSIHIRDCMKAGTHAELAAEMGLQTTPTVIYWGETLERFRHGEHKTAFPKWKHFCAAYNARVAELQAEQDKEEARRCVQPSHYKCVAPGCPVEASKGHMLRAYM
ncbi:hypothetical protein B0H14DRAFT_3729833 [Mycena olivaceomarginata]|nr:hypothetical protein B0H14DRAFT_3729833 [Mycena olivaceomarginata]